MPFPIKRTAKTVWPAKGFPNLPAAVDVSAVDHVLVDGLSAETIATKINEAR
jgi:hypothetical protein